MPIKGAYLICCELAGKMRFRRMDDIDILVKREDFDKVCTYFSNLPQVTFLKHKWYFEKEFSYSFGTFKCHMEIHWLLNYPFRFFFPTKNLFFRAIQPDKSMRLMPSSEDALLLLICHSLVHISFELRETLFEEIGLIINQTEFNWGKFWISSAASGIEAYIYSIVGWYNKETNSTVILNKRHLYARLLSNWITLRRYNQMPHWLRRIILEFPFIIKPTLWILINTLQQRR